MKTDQKRQEGQISNDIDPARLNTALCGTMFAGRIRYFPEIESTNTAAMQVAAGGADEGTVFLADRQSAGRGRNGHGWHSQPGAAILMSVVLRPRIAPAQSLWLSLMAGIATQQAVQRVCEIVCDLRWPNDLLIGSKKVCGILTEISADSEQLRFAVIGIGVNVNQSFFPNEIAGLATSLRMASGRNWSRTELVCALLESLEEQYRRAIEPGGDELLLQQLEASSTYVRGKRVHVDEAGGYEGVTDGLDARGFLRVRTTSGVRTVLSGGVRQLQQ